MVVSDNQCTISWQESGWPGVEPTRMFGQRYRIGETIALRPGAGPVRLFRICEIDAVEQDNPVPQARVPG